MLGRTDRRLRLVALLAGFIVVAGLLLVRHAYWAVVRAGELSQQASEQLIATEHIPVQRGVIYDRNGTLLATTTYRDTLAAFPAEIPPAKARQMSADLARVLRADAAGAAALRTTLTSAARYAVLAHDLTEAQSAAVRQGLDDGSFVQLELDAQPVRVYPDPGGAPDTTLANQLLGFVNATGDGQYGVEQRFQLVLAGRPQVVTGVRDVAGHPMADSQTVVDAGQPGADLRLTIDASLQLQLEKELYAAWVADKAESVSAVAMDPKTGAVLAWASVPGYDANAYRNVADTNPGRFVDPIVSKVYEPGSVMKMFVAAAGYSSGAFTPSTRFNDTGTLRVGHNIVDDADKRRMGWLRFEDGIAFSRNVVATRAAMRLGKDTRSASQALYATWRSLGIGAKTGVDVANEVPGIVVDPSVQRWADIDLANRSFGQGVAVTPLQLVCAYSTMMNGGLDITPHVVAAVAGQDVQFAAPRQVLRSTVADQLRQLMVHVVTKVPWYRAGTVMPGYTVGGKTGTAEIWDPQAQAWVHNTFNFTFVGFVGRDAPSVIIAVQIDHAKPQILRQGVFQQPITTYELFRRIAQDTVKVLDIAPLGAAGPDATPIPSTPTDGIPYVPELPAPSSQP